MNQIKCLTNQNHHSTSTIYSRKEIQVYSYNKNSIEDDKVQYNKEWCMSMLMFYTHWLLECDSKETC